MKVVVSPFCQSRDQNTCRVPLDTLVAEITGNFAKAQVGYRDGVLLIPVNPIPFIGRLRTLQPGDVLTGAYKARQEGEIPRKEIRVLSDVPDALVAVDAVLYRKDVLAEGNENSDLTADYEVVTFLGKISDEDQPMSPETLMANYFLDSGGTATNMSDSEFVASLGRSYAFWRGRAIVAAI